MQLIEPVLHVAEGAEEAEAGFGEAEGGVEGVFVLLALVDAGELLGFGGGLGLGIGAGSGTVAGFELGEDGLELSIGDLLFEAGDLGRASSSRRVALRVAIWTSFWCWASSASTLARRASAAVSLALARRLKSKKGMVIWRPKLTLLG